MSPDLTPPRWGALFDWDGVLVDSKALHQAAWDQVAAEFGAPRLGDSYGWEDLPAEEAFQRALAVQARHGEPGGPKFAFDFRPHSHHWQVMRLVRAAEHEAGVIEVGGAKVLMALTSVGDGFFPVHLDVDADGLPAALRIDISRES